MTIRLCSTAFAAIVSIFLTNANAGEKDAIHVFSFDDTSCGAWVRSQQEPATRQAYLSWFRGFFSGYNYGSETKELLSAPDNDTLALYIDKACKEQPLVSFISAAFALIKEKRVKK